MNRFAQQSASETEYFLTDALGSVRQLTNSNGFVSMQQSFDPFGSLLTQSGAATSSFGFAGEWSDATGLQYLRARYYSPSQGRFVTQDPFPGMLGMPGTMHPYVYGLNNPTLYIDPSGEFVEFIIIGIVGGIIGGLGYYGLQQIFSDDPCVRWDWYQAAFWGSAGAVIGAAGVATFFGGWWVGVQLGWWGKTIADYIGADGDPSNEIIGATKAIRDIGGTAGHIVQDARQFWTSTTNFQGNLVYQRPGLINPSLTQGGLTNLQRMQQGLAPIGPDGSPIQLHHMLQTMNGPIAEVTQTLHRIYSSMIHINPSTIQSGIDRVAFNAWRIEYWISRARDFIDQ